MHRGRLRVQAVTSAVAMGVALLVNGCEARAGGAPPTAQHTSQATVAAPQAPLPDPPEGPADPNEAPPAPSVASFDGLDARLRQATADGAKTGARFYTAVMDRTTGQVVSNGAGTAFPLASVVKLFIADNLLLQVAKGQTTLSDADRQQLDIMLRSSDDGAAQNFWDRSGQSAIIARVVARYGLTGTTAPWNGHWDVTTSTASDLVRYYNMLLNGSGGLPPDQAAIIIGDLAQSTPTGTDGYPQRFGIPEGLYGEPVAVKQGWFCCWNGANQLHVTSGIIGADHRYVMAIGSLDPTDAATARAHLTQAVKTMFPGGTI
jgi:hypothetical protein